MLSKLIFYPTLAWNILLGRWLRLRNWWDEVDENIVLGALPFPSDVPALDQLGIKAVVNTCREYDGPVSAYRQFGIEQFHMPTVDFTHPEYEDVCKAVDFIENQVKLGHKIYVHCKAGRARSATVVMCWLIKSRQLPAIEIQKLLQRVRPHVNPDLASRPVVQRFEREFLRQSPARNQPE